MMSMYCFQCQETAKNQGCTVRGVCGKTEETANLQDLLIYVLRGISIYGEKAKQAEELDKKEGVFIAQSLFLTKNKANNDKKRINAQNKKGMKIRDENKKK